MSESGLPQRPSFLEDSAETTQQATQQPTHRDTTTQSASHTMQSTPNTVTESSFNATHPATSTTTQQVLPDASSAPDATQVQTHNAPSVHHNAPTPQVEPREPQGPRTLSRSLVAGALAGVVSSGAVIAVLLGTGVLGNRASTTASAPITIQSHDGDTTTAQAVAAKVLPSIVSISVTTSDGSGIGSGVFLDTKGNIITNYHVVDGATAITVTTGSGKSYSASLVGSDSSSDLAVIKADLEGDQVTPVEVGDSDELVAGSWVMTAGTPMGLDQSVSEGIVSGLARNDVMRSTTGTMVYTNMIQVDAAINPGNSGGALVNDKGQLVGITTLLQSDTQTFAGIGYAIPGNYAIDIAQKIIAGQKVLHAYLGVNMVTVNAYNARINNLSVNQGAYVASVEPGTAAAEAGLQKGDIITKIDGTSVTSANSVILAVRSHAIGDTITITYMRDAKEQTTTATLKDDESLQLAQQQSQQQGSGLSDGTSSDQQRLQDLLDSLQRQRNSSSVS